MSPAVSSGGSGRWPLSDADAFAVLAAVDGVGPISLERLLAAFGGPNEILAAARDDGATAIRAATRDPDDPRRATLTVSAAAGIAASGMDPRPTLAAMRAARVVAIGLADAAYPRRLREIELPPRVLFLRGEPSALEAVHAVAVVGTRRPTDLGRRIAARIGASLSRGGALVISGLAIGIDGTAHEAVVNLGGVTVAVIGGGHDLLSPRSHDRLADAIVDGGGAIVSEHAPGTAPTKGTFPRRNRVISGMADAVVVVEAGARSGALVTAAWALEQGRECFLVPGGLEAPQSAGCLAWLRDYAGVARIVAGVPQLLEDLGLPAAAAYGAPESTPERQQPGGALRPSVQGPRRAGLPAIALELPAREARILRALEVGATTADELGAVAELPIGAVLSALTALEALGFVIGSYGRYRVSDDLIGGGWVGGGTPSAPAAERS